MNNKVRKLNNKKKWKLKAAIASISLLAVMTPLTLILSSCSSSTKVNYENLINPAEGSGKLMSYGYKDIYAAPAPLAAGEPKVIDVTYSKTIKEFLKNESSAQLLLENFGKNIIVNWFAGIKYSKNHYEEYQKILKDTDKSWKDTVENMKKQHGDSWQYFLQTDVLDQYGGLIENWYFNEIASRVISSFDSIVSSNISIGIPNVDSTNLTYDDLFSSTGKVWNGWTPGQRNKLSFTPENSSSQAFDIAAADFHEFIFDQYVREKMPLITSMTLFKHETTSNLGDFFDKNRIMQLPEYKDNDIVGATGSYKWQAYPDKSIVSQNGEWNSTDKYVNFIKDYGTNGAGAVKTDIGGAININVRYTDDSATLYKINLDDVFETSFTPYASASTYKFNTGVLGISADAKVASANALKSGLGTTPGTEIMSNFLASAETTGYFKLPDQIASIMSKGPGATPDFLAKYNGMKYIADIVDITGTPYILARNEAGVHIIGIDRLEAMKTASTSFDGLINEIKNTLLWRHMVSKNPEIQDDTGFSVDIASELSSYYSSNKWELIYKYINAKQEQRTSNQAPWTTKDNQQYDAKKYLFSSEYTSTAWTNGVPNFDPNGNLIPSTSVESSANDNLVDPEFKKYIDAYLDYFDYKKYSSDPSTVTSKILDAQTTYEGKWYTNAVIENGIAGQSPYTSNYTSDAIANKQLAFPSVLQLISSDGKTKPTATDHYKFATLKTKRQTFESASNTYFTYLNGGQADANANNNFVLKTVEYQKYEQNAYLDTDVIKQKDTNTYLTLMNPLNISLNTSQSGGFKLVAEVDKILAQIDDRIYKYDPSSPSIALVGYSADSLPIAINDANSTNTINAHITNAILKTKISSYTANNGSFMYGNWVSEFSTSPEAAYKKLLSIALDVANNDVENKYSDSALAYFKTILTIQYAFDWNPETGKYEFTKFRDFLVDSTENFQKSAFVWKMSDYLQAYDTADKSKAYGFNLEQDFKFKNPIKITNQINGYAYSGATPIALTSQGYYDSSTVTLTQDANYFNIAPIDNAGSKKFVGFKGIQFQSSNSLETQEATSLFSSNLKVNTGSGETVTWTEKGTLYNLGGVDKGRQELVDRIGNLQNWSQITATKNWLRDEFNVDVKAVDDAMKPGTNEAKLASIEELKKIVQDTSKLPNALFEPVRGLQIANSSLVNGEPKNAKFFGTDKLAVGQLVVSQFNKYDVIKLFDTHGNDSIIDENDKGVKWDVTTSDGFLGTSAEAFFISAYSWATTDQTFASIAYNEMLDIQNNVKTTDETLKPILVNTYTRPLNDIFGDKWAVNYKKPVKVS